MIKFQLFAGITALMIGLSGSAVADTLYSTIPNPVPPGMVSLGYEANQTQEFGDLIQFAGGDPADLNSVTVVMDNWAYESKYETVGTSTGFNLPLTLNLYDVGADNTVGALITSISVNASIPWRPEPDPTDCPAGSTNYNNDYSSGGTCYTGSTSAVTFSLSGLSVPGEIIYGLAYNTVDYGYAPVGGTEQNPINSLNFALATSAPSVGDNPLPDTAYWNTATAGDYTDRGASGVDVFRQDTNWTPYSGAIEFDGTATPEPATFGLIGLSLLGLAAIRKKLLA